MDANQSSSVLLAIFVNVIIAKLFKLVYEEQKLIPMLVRVITANKNKNRLKWMDECSIIGSEQTIVKLKAPWAMKTRPKLGDVDPAIEGTCHGSIKSPI